MEGLPKFGEIGAVFMIYVDTSYLDLEAWDTECVR